MSGKLAPEIVNDICEAYRTAPAYQDVNGARIALIPYRGSDFSLPAYKAWQPAKEFEKLHGLKGLSQDYHLPEGLVSRNLEEYLLVCLSRQWRGEISEAECDRRMHRLCDELKKLNPDTVGKIPVQTAGDARHVIMGVASAFNPHDIEWYLRYGGLIAMRKDENYARLDVEVRSYFREAEQMCWAPGPLTLQKIKHQILAKPSAAPATRGFKP